MPELQPELFDLESFGPSLPGSDVELTPSPPAYPDPHSELGKQDPNPLYDEKYARDADTFSIYAGADALYRTQGPETQWVHPPDVTSPQASVNTPSVEHLAQHATGLDPAEPMPFVAKQDRGMHLMDGNHRVNAAQRRGQLLMPVEFVDIDLAEMEGLW